MDIASLAGALFSPVLSLGKSLLGFLLFAAVLGAVAFLIGFFVTLRTGIRQEAELEELERWPDDKRGDENDKAKEPEKEETALSGMGEADGAEKPALSAYFGENADIPPQLPPPPVKRRSFLAWLKRPYIKSKPYDLLRWMLVDFLERDKHRGEFREYGFTFYVGRQGAGKTASMVDYLERIKVRYPDCLIVTNFGYYHADRIMRSWRDLLEIRNGTKGVIFAIDEIHSEYSSAAWKDVPDNLLAEISQQRKQRVKIVATAQYFTRVAKPLREQAATVVVCKTFFGRLTSGKVYDAVEYASVVDNPLVIGKKLKPIAKHSFVQSDYFRGCYDTYEKINRMAKLDFIPRGER